MWSSAEHAAIIPDNTSSDGRLETHNINKVGLEISGNKDEIVKTLIRDDKFE